MTVATCFPVPPAELTSHLVFLMHCCKEVTWQTTKWGRRHLGTNKMALFWDFTTAVVGMCQAKTSKHSRGLDSDSGVFDSPFRIMKY